MIKKGTTYGLWLLVAFWTGLTFTMYWVDAPTLVVDMLTGLAPYAAYFTTFFLTTTTFVMAGLAREQVCTYMCPYARFQSAMFDHDTLIISYDRKRGESTKGRTKPHRGFRTTEERQAKGFGECIDCGHCVQVCPMGIDIRSGLQYQCISCALCIDACEHDLISYTSENALNGGKTRFLRPTTLGYGAILTVATAILVWSVLTRAPYSGMVEQIRQPLYTQLSDGSIRNSYEIKLNNKLTAPLTVVIHIEGLPGATLDMDGMERIALEPQERLKLLARVQIPPMRAKEEREDDGKQEKDEKDHDRHRTVTFVIESLEGVTAHAIRREVPFYAPNSD